MRPRPSRLSFTLLETILVVALLGVFASVVAVNFHGFGKKAALNSAARMVSDIVMLARNEALASGRIWKVEYEIGGRRMALVPPGQMDGVKPRTLPRGVSFGEVSLGPESMRGKGWASVTVRPDGFLTPHAVHLQNDAGAIRAISFNPVTGTATVFEERIKPQTYVFPYEG